MKIMATSNSQNEKKLLSGLALRRSGSMTRLVSVIRLKALIFGCMVFGICGQGRSTPEASVLTIPPHVIAESIPAHTFSEVTVEWGTCPCVKEGQPWASVLGITSTTHYTDLIQSPARTDDGIFVDSVAISRYGRRHGENSDATWHIAAIATATSYICEASDIVNQTSAKFAISNDSAGWSNIDAMQAIGHCIAGADALFGQ